MQNEFPGWSSGHWPPLSQAPVTTSRKLKGPRLTGLYFLGGCCVRSTYSLWHLRIYPGWKLGPVTREPLFSTLSAWISDILQVHLGFLFVLFCWYQGPNSRPWACQAGAVWQLYDWPALVKWNQTQLLINLSLKTVIQGKETPNLLCVWNAKFMFPKTRNEC